MAEVRDLVTHRYAHARVRIFAAGPAGAAWFCKDDEACKARREADRG